MPQNPPSISAGGSSPQKTTGGTSAPKKPRKTTRLQKLIADPKTRAKVPDDVLRQQNPALFAERQRLRGEHTDRLLANPGERSKLPDSMLSPDQLKQRQANAYGAAPAAPGSSYTNSAMHKLLATLTDQKYGAAGAQIAQEKQSIPLWFQAYRDQIAGAQQRQTAGAGAQVASLGQMATQAAGDTGGLAGAPMDAAGAARAQAAAQIRSAGVQNQAALAQNLGGLQDAFLANQGVLSQGQQAAALLANAAKNTQLEKDKGDFRVTQRQQILGDESDQALKDALTKAQIGSTDANTAATKASTTKTKTETKKTQAEQAFFKEHGYYPPTGQKTDPGTSSMASTAAAHGFTLAQWKAKTPEQRRAIIKADKKTAKTSKPDDPTSGPGSLTSAAEAKTVSQINKVFAALQNPTTTVKDVNGNTTIKPSTPEKVRDELRAQHLDPRVIDVALSLFHNDGKIGPHGIDVAHDLGIHVGPHWKRAR